MLQSPSSLRVTAIALLGMAFIVTGSMFPSSAHAADPGTPLGPEFSVASSLGLTPVVARSPNGTFAVAWQTADVDFSVKAQLYAPDGTALTPIVGVISVGALQGIAVNDDGAFVVTGKLNSSATRSTTLLAQKFDASGMPVGSLNTVTEVPYPRSSLHQIDITAAVTMNAGGDFAVGWDKAENIAGGIDTTLLSYQTVYARLYNTDGSARTDAFSVQNRSILLNPVYTLFPSEPSMALDAGDALTVVWEKARITSRSPNVVFQNILYARRFNADGAALTPQFRVSDSGISIAEYYHGGYDRGNSRGIAMDSTGQLNVAYLSDDGNGNINIRSARFSSLGKRLGSDMTPWPVSLNALPSQPRIVWYGTEGFVVSSLTPAVNPTVSNNQQRINALYMSATDLTASPVFPVSTETFSNYTTAVDSTGNLVAVWSQYQVANDDSSLVVKGRLFSGP